RRERAGGAPARTRTCGDRYDQVARQTDDGGTRVVFRNMDEYVDIIQHGSAAVPELVFAFTAVTSHDEHVDASFIRTDIGRRADGFSDEGDARLDGVRHVPHRGTGNGCCAHESDCERYSHDL